MDIKTDELDEVEAYKREKYSLFKREHDEIVKEIKWLSEKRVEANIRIEEYCRRKERSNSDVRIREIEENIESERDLIDTINRRQDGLHKLSAILIEKMKIVME